MFNNNEIEVRFNEYVYGKAFRHICDVYPIVPAGKIKKTWWKIMKAHYDILLSNPGINSWLTKKDATIKYCPGIFDFTNYGYIIPAWQDFQFWVNDDGDIEWEVPEPMAQKKNIRVHSKEQVATSPILGDTANCILKLVSPWFLSTHKGNSIIFCKPFYHHSNDFDVCPGILDCDIDRQANKGVNLFIRFNVRNKVIHIKAGEPLAQFIPFKRTNWKLKHVELEDNYKDNLGPEDEIFNSTRFESQLVDKNSLSKFRHDDTNKKFE